MLSGKDFGYEVIRAYKKYELVRCPYHNDNHPSALFFPVDAKFRCLGCGKVVDHSKGLGYAGIEEMGGEYLARFNLIGETHDYLKGTVAFADDDSQQYLIDRGIDMFTANNFGIRYRLEENRKLIVFPHYDPKTRKCIGTVNRLVWANTPHVRYFNEGERNPLWPHADIDLEKETLIISEGAFKTMAIAQAAAELSIKNVVTLSTFGSLWTEDLASIIAQCPENVVYIGDADDPGRKFAMNFKRYGCRAFVVNKPFDDQSKEERVKSLDKIWSKVNDKKLFKSLSTDLAA